MQNNPSNREEGELEKEEHQSEKNQSILSMQGNQTEYMKRLPSSQWGSRSSDLYEKVHQVGEGTFGKVYKAKIKSVSGKQSLVQGQHVALKKILMDNEKEGFPITAIREIMILKRLNHENIIKLIEIVTSKPSDKNKNRGNVYLVFEYMEHDLTGLVDNKINFTPSMIKCILHQILTGVNYMHTNNIIHRDIKGANILINNRGEVKIADFGLARIHNPNPNVNKQYTNRVVTLWYRSPELLLGSTDYGPSVDIWSVGCLFSELLTGVAPFRGNKENEQVERIFEKLGTPTEETWPKVTTLRYYSQLTPRQIYPNTLRAYYADNKKVNETVFDLLTKMLELDPNKRISAKEALEHSYFKEEPFMCDPKDLPKIEKDSHEFQSRQNKKQQQQMHNQNPQNRDMAVGKHGYGHHQHSAQNANPNYYSKQSHDTKFKIEETRINNPSSEVLKINQTSFSRLESLIPNSNAGNSENTFLNTKRQVEGSLEGPAESYKKQKTSAEK